MNNSLVSHLIAYVTALLKDCAFAYTKPSDLRRDQTRLLHELANHGSRVLTLDLPALNKHFDRCLAEGFYTPSGLRYGAPKKGTRTPALFGNLYLKVFDTQGKLRDAPCIDSIFLLRCLLASLKKLKLTCSKRSVNDAVKDFIAIEKEIRSPTYSWAADFMDFTNLRPHFRDGAVVQSSDAPELELAPTESFVGTSRSSLDILQRVCDRVSSQFGDLHNERISELPKHGPGVVANQKRGTSKYLFRWWPRKLESVFPYDLYATTNFGVGSDHDREVEWGLNHEFPSRLISVPKTLKAPRLIAAEPVENQWIQQLVRNQLEARLQDTALRHCVDFRSQVHNQKLALSASRDGGYATVDLSSASDRLSCWTVERVFRSNQTLLERLHASRTRWLRNRVVPELGEYLLLRKFAAMGSAVTFPVQSLVYACVAITALIISDGDRVTGADIERQARRVRIFGDDIIIPTYALGVLVELLTFLGLKVNVDKTFGTGKFRESCGVDAYGGHDVTPAYLTSPSTNVRASEFGTFLDVSNNYFLKGLWNASDLIRTWADPKMNKLGVSNELGGEPSWYSFSGSTSAALKKRWNDVLHRWECRQLIPRGKVERLPTRGSYLLSQWFHSKPRPRDEEFLTHLSPKGFKTSGTEGSKIATWRSGWARLRTHILP